MAVLALLAASSYAPLGADTAVDSAEATGRAGGPGQGHGVHQFVGSWRLVSFEARTADGHVIYPFGRDADGVLIQFGGTTLVASVSWRRM